MSKSFLTFLFCFVSDCCSIILCFLFFVHFFLLFYSYFLFFIFFFSYLHVGTLEDVSISVWLRAYGVIPEHVKWFSNAKNFGCVDGVVSLSDLSILAIHTIHTNVINGDNFCLGMMGETKEDGSTSAWQKQNETSTV